MTKKNLYILSMVGCAIGYIWIAVNTLIATRSIWDGCLFKQCYGIPCPSCGSTRAVLRLLQGDVAGSLQLNPLGLILALLLVTLPLWMLIDLVGQSASCYTFYQRMCLWLRNKWIGSLIVILLTINWIWNITKAL
jgi:hypothetical protein